jgi:spermidine synthase
MKKSFIFSLFILGFTSLISQVIFLRELMVSFYGNEFFLGLVLAVWLFWTALGSFCLIKLFKKISLKAKLFLSCHILAALLLPLLVGLIRLAKSWTPVVGQIPDLIPSLILAVLIPAPLCLILGLHFTAMTKYLSRASPARTVNQAYFIEAIGFVLAGLLFSYWLVLFNVWLSISLLACLNFLAVLLILVGFPQRKYLFLRITSLCLIFIFALLSFPQFNQPLEQKTQSWRFPQQELIKITNSPYGQLAVNQADQQYNFYQSGLWLASSQENPFNESLAHFSLLAHKQPQNILLIGHGFDGLIKEILKHQPKQIAYLELDPYLIRTVWSYLPYDFQKSLQDQVVKIINQDGRYFLKTGQNPPGPDLGGEAPEKFDLAIINLPDPSTALLNRFYTQECFEETKNQLQEAGILAIYLSFSPNYQNQDLIKLEASIYQTLKKVFPYLIILPEEGTVLFLATAQKDVLTSQPGPLLERWPQRNLQTKFINQPYLDYVLTNQRAETLNKVLAEEKVKINQDIWPISYAYNFLFWTNYFHPQLADFLRLSLKIDFWWLLILFLFLAILTFPLRKKIKPNKILWSVMAAAGFSLMATEIILIFTYQSFFGYLYYRLALLIAFFMLGLAGGTWLANRQTKLNISFFSISKIHLAIIIYLGLIYLFFWSAIFNKVNLFLSRDILFPLLAIIIGWLVGLVFAKINYLYGQFKKEKSPFQTGFIYSADLFGSCLGALLAALFLVPLLGVLQTLLVLIGINLLAIILLQRPRL